MRTTIKFLFDPGQAMEMTPGMHDTPPATPISVTELTARIKKEYPVSLEKFGV